MASLKNAKNVSITNGVLTIDRPGTYTISGGPDGKFKINGPGGQAVNLTAAEFFSITSISAVGSTISFASINLSNVGFTQANTAVDGKFEPTQNHDALLSLMIGTVGVAATLAALTVNGSKADAIKLVWDHLDDNYTYYNTVINDAFIDLGIYYANYLQSGGAPILDVAKFTADNGDADTIPQRLQTMHDNLLGNFDELSIVDKFGAGADAILDRIDAAGLNALIGERGNYSDGRPIYSGNQGADQEPSREFDDNFFQY